MTKCKLALVVLISILLTILSGCRQGNPNDRVTSLRMVVWGTAADEKKWNKKLQEFYKVHPNVRVRLEYTPWDRTFYKLLVATAGNKAPDATIVSSVWFAPAAAKGLFADLTETAARDKDFDLSDFYPSAVDRWGKYNGRLYAIPAGVDIYGMWFNKTMFDRSGIPYPDDTWTWKEYLDAAKKLTKDTDGDGRTDQWGTTQNMWQAYIWQNGGDILSKDKTKCTLDQPAAYEGLQFMADLANKYHVAPTAKDMADISTVKLFTNGQVGMYFSGSWAVPLYFDKDIKNFTYDVAPMPKGKCRAAFYGGASYAVMKGSKHKELAWELVKFMVSKKSLRERAIKEQVVPSRISVAESNAFLNLPGPPEHRKVFLDAISYGRTLPAVTCSDEMNGLIWNDISLSLIGKESAKDACVRVTGRINDLLMYDRGRQ